MSTVIVANLMPEEILQDHFLCLFRCLFLSFTLGFAILSAWITNVADVIYLRNVETGKGRERSKEPVLIRTYTQKVRTGEEVSIAQWEHSRSMPSWPGFESWHRRIFPILLSLMTAHC